MAFDCLAHIMKRLSFEAFGTQETKVDHDQNIVQGVQVIRIGEAKGHGLYVDEVTLSQVVELANKKIRVPASLNHYSGAEAFIGYFTNFTQDAEAVRADLHLFETSPFKGYVLELASRMPEGLGFSIVFYMREPEFIEGKPFARVESLEGCDLVKTPAATSGIFEAKPFDMQKEIMENNPAVLKIEATKAELETETTSPTGNIEIAPDLNAVMEKLGTIEALLRDMVVAEVKEEAVPEVKPDAEKYGKISTDKPAEALEVTIEEESAIEQFNKLTGAERTKFWRQNRSALLQFVKTK